MEYYSTTKKMKILKFEGKWVELDISVLSRTTQTQKTNTCLLYVNISLKYLDMCFIGNILKG